MSKVLSQREAKSISQSMKRESLDLLGSGYKSTMRDLMPIVALELMGNN